MAKSCSACNPGYALQGKSCVPAIGSESLDCDSTPAPADVNGTLCAATRGLNPQAQCQPDGAPMCSTFPISASPPALKAVTPTELLVDDICSEWNNATWIPDWASWKSCELMENIKRT